MPNVKKWLVKAGTGYANIINAAQAGDLAAVKTLIAAGYNVNRRRDSDGETALLAALKRSHLNIAEYLLKVPGIDVNLTDHNGVSALLRSVENGLNAIVSTLILDYNADINQANNRGVSPLLIAIQKNNYPIVELLLSSDNIDPDQQDNNKVSPIYLAAQNNLIKILELLVKKADLNKTSFRGDTALISALKRGNLRMAEFLRHENSNTEITDKHGITPLMYAIKNQFNDFAIELIKTVNTENLNNISLDGGSALIWACEKDNQSILNALFQRKDLELNPSRCEHTPLLVASLCQNEVLVKTLINKGADVNHSNQEGSTALLVAIENGNFELVNSLILHGAYVDAARVSDKKTPLILALEIGNLELARELIQNGADVNHKTLSGTSPLKLAFENGYIDFVREILANGADESLVSDMSEYQRFKKIEGLIQYIEENSACEIACPISYDSLAVDGSFVDKGRRFPAFTTGVGKGCIYNEKSIKDWIRKNSSPKDPVINANISFKILFDISSDIEAYFAPMIRDMVDAIKDLSDKEIIDLSLVKPEKEEDEWLFYCQDEYSDNILYIPLSQIHVHEFTELRNKLADLRKESVQETKKPQQREQGQQSVDQHQKKALDQVGYAEEKGYDPSGMDANHKEMLGTKGAEEKVMRHKGFRGLDDPASGLGK